MRNLYLFIALCLFSIGYGQNPADIDVTFNNKPNKPFFDRKVTQSVVQSDGKIIIVGDFYGYYNGLDVSSSYVSGEFVSRKRILRLNSDQSVDANFNAGTLNIISIGGVQSDGKIIVAVDNFPVPGQPGITYQEPMIARLNANGTLDNTFSYAATGNGGNLKVLNNNKILYIGPYPGVAKRLNSNGTEDMTFPLVSGSQYKFFPDGSIITFNQFSDGVCLQKYFSNGAEDAVFNSDYDTKKFNCQVLDVEIQSDGKVLVGGSFNKFNGNTSVMQLARLKTDGTLDAGFNSLGFGVSNIWYTDSPYNTSPCQTYEIKSIQVQSNGKILVGGTFSSYGTNAVKSLLRLNSDGTIDNSFDVGSGLDRGVASLKLQSSGDVLVCVSNDGDYATTSYPVFNDYHVSTFFKLDTNGKLLNEEKNSNFPVKGVIKKSNNDLILLGESRVPYNRGIKLIGNNNGNPIFNTNLFRAFKAGQGLMLGSPLISVTCGIAQPDGKIIVGGHFTKYNTTAANGLIRLNSDYTVDSSVDLGTALTNGTFPVNIEAIVLQPDGKVLIGGEFDSFNGTPIPGGLVRISSNGLLDTSFNYAGTYPEKIVLQSDGKIITLTGNVIYRFNPDGTLDSGFSTIPTYANSDVFALQSDNKIIFDGNRYNTDGTIDSTFTAYSTFPNKESCLLVQADDKILVGSRANQTNPYEPGKLMRLNSNGTIDTAFDTGTGFDGSVYSIFSESDGKILVGGDFAKYKDVWCDGLVRLLGGDSHLIKGKNKFDFNNNGCDSNDASFPNMKYNLVSGTANVSIVSNTTGDYFIPLPSGTHTLTPVLEHPNYVNVTPASVTVNFPAQGSVVVQDFCITPNGIHPDLEVVLIPIGPSRPGFDAIYKLIYKNKGNQLHSGTVSLNFNDAVLDFVSATPSASTSVINTRTWNYSNLYPFETREITLKLNLNSPMETPSLIGGEVLNYTAIISSAQVDETPNDNNFTLHQTVVNSYDPNDKTCLEGTTVGTDKVGEYVHYVIRFENTGTYAAQNINVTDIIDTNKFDVDSLIPLSGSHLFTTKISQGNKVEFKFENINLPFAAGTNTGYVAFKIKTKSTLVTGDTFGGNSAIYFDYNAAITTNTYTTTIQALSVQDFSFGNYFSLYPNPVSDLLHVSKKESIEISSIHVYNTLGQLVIVIPNAKDIASIDVSHLAAGNYFVKINSDKGTSNTKFIKQ